MKFTADTNKPPDQTPTPADVAEAGNSTNTPDPDFPSHRVTAFCAYLRECGFDTGTREVALMLQVLGFMAGRQRLESVEKAWKPVACKTRKQVLAWHETFIAFWAPHQVRGTVKVTGSTRQTRDLRQVVQSIQSAGEASAPNAGQSTSGGSDPPAAVADNSTAVSKKSMGGASQTDPLDDRSGQQWMPSELSRLEKLARRVRRQLQPKPTRRWRLAPNGDRLHTRQTVRNSGKLLGEGVLPAWRSRRREVPNLIILCDVSRSMEAHVALSLRVARAFTRVMPVRSFVFHVRTTEVTELLRHDTPRVQERINAVTAGFQAGTRIAHAVREITRGSQRVTLNRATRLWVFSDGYDTDPPEELAAALKAVRGRGCRVAWFYPTKKQPAASAVMLASESIEQWIPAANFELLAQHARELR